MSKSKLAVITGASRGIGKATAYRFAKEGYTVVLLARSLEGLEQAQKEIKSQGGQAHIFSVDLTKPASVEPVFKEIKETYGVPDVLVNNAGAGRWLSLEETSNDEMLSMLSIPYCAAFYSTKQIIKEMKERNSGSIINVNTPASILAIPGSIGYTASRFALRGFSEGLQAECRKTNIIVSTVTFGKVDTTYFENNPGSEERIPKISQIIPTLTSEKAAEIILDTVKNKKEEVIEPLMLKLFSHSHRLFPNLVKNIVWRTTSF